MTRTEIAGLVNSFVKEATNNSRKYEAGNSVGYAYSLGYVVSLFTTVLDELDLTNEQQTMLKEMAKVSDVQAKAALDSINQSK